MERAFDVFAYVNGAPTKLGVVTATSQTHADKKAAMLYRYHQTWTKEKVLT
jgi:hypothetical protein